MAVANQPDIHLGLHALITMTCAHGHVIGQWVDVIHPMYPVRCGSCRELFPHSYIPSFIATDVVTGGFTPGGAFIVAPPIETIPADTQLGGS